MPVSVRSWSIEWKSDKLDGVVLRIQGNSQNAHNGVLPLISLCDFCYAFDAVGKFRIPQRNIVDVHLDRFVEDGVKHAHDGLTEVKELNECE